MITVSGERCTKNQSSSCGDIHITAHLLPLSATLPLVGSSLCSVAQTALFWGASKWPFLRQRAKSLRMPCLPDLSTNQWQSRLGSKLLYKRGQFRQEHSFNALVKYRAHQDEKEEITPDCPATMRHGPGTTSPSRTIRQTAQLCNYIYSSHCNTPWTYHQPTTVQSTSPPATKHAASNQCTSSHATLISLKAANSYPSMETG
jgi:hypothetical protein